MKIRACLLIALLAAIVSHMPAIGQDAAQGDKRLARADHTATIEGDLKGAIEQYRRIAAGAGANRQLAAEALLRMAECYRKLGDAEARAVYQRVLREFADQRTHAARARAALAGLEGPRPSLPSGVVSRQIWKGPQVDSLGSVAPDGQSLSFVDWSTGDLAMRSLATGENRRLTNKGSWDDSTEFALFSRISPDGRLIAYNWMKKNFGWEVRVGPLDGSTHRVVFSSDANEDYAHPEAWSPDGRDLAVLRTDANRVQIALFAAAGGQPRVLKTSGPRPVGRMAFSPDGRHLAYEVIPNLDLAERDIFLIRVDGSADVPVVEHPADDYILGWLPDGRLLFASDRGGTIDAWVQPVSNGKPQGAPMLAKKDLGNVDTLGVTRAGALFYSLRASGPDVYRAPLHPASHQVGQPSRVPRRFINTNMDADWSPDGRRVAFVSARGWPPGRAGARLLCVVDLESGVQRELPLQLRFPALPRWSPDARTLLVRTSDEEGRKLVLVDVATAEAKPLIRAEGVQVARWSHDGSSIYVLRTDYGTPNQTGQVSWIAKRDLKTGAEQELFRESASPPVGDMLINDLSVSPDGALLAFTVRRNGGKAVMTLPTAGGAAREIFRSGADFHIPNFASLTWTPDGKEVVFVRASAQVPGGNTRAVPAELWSVPLGDGQPRPLGFTAEGLSRPQIHPGTRQILFQTGITTQEIWALENIAK